MLEASRFVHYSLKFILCLIEDIFFHLFLEQANIFAASFEVVVADSRVKTFHFFNQFVDALTLNIIVTFFEHFVELSCALGGALFVFPLLFEVFTAASSHERIKGATLFDKFFELVVKRVIPFLLVEVLITLKEVMTCLEDAF